jgi:hypothetical protein
MLVLAYLFVTRLTYEYNSEAAAAAALKVSRQVLVTLRKLAAKNDPSERRKVAGPIQRLTDAERDWITAALPRVTRQVPRSKLVPALQSSTWAPLTSPACRRSMCPPEGSPASDLVVVGTGRWSAQLARQPMSWAASVRDDPRLSVVTPAVTDQTDRAASVVAFDVPGTVTCQRLWQASSVLPPAPARRQRAP